MSPAAGEPDLTQLWGIIQRAVRDPELRSRSGGVVQNVWESYKQAYVAAGVQPPRLTVQQVNPLVAIASAQVRAEQRLATTIASVRSGGPEQAITAQHIAPDIDSQRGAGSTLPASYRVRFDVDLNVDGIRMSHTLTWNPEISLPATVSSLLDALDEAARAAVENDSPVIGAEYLGLGDYVSITAL